MTVGVPNPASGSGARAYTPRSRALFARMAVSPSAARKIVIDDCIRSMEAQGLWSFVKSFHVFAAHTQQASLLNWEGTAELDAALVGNPVFTVDKGYSGITSTAGVTMPIVIQTLGSTNSRWAFLFGGIITPTGSYLQYSTGDSALHTSGTNGRQLYSDRSGPVGGLEVNGPSPLIMGEKGPDLFFSGSGPFDSGNSWTPGTGASATSIRTSRASTANCLLRFAGFATVHASATEAQTRALLACFSNVLTALKALED
jgi:hypothetical protein